MKKQSHSKQILLSGAQVFGSKISINILLIGFGIYFAHILSKEEMAALGSFFLLTNLASFFRLGIAETVVKRVPELLAENRSTKASSIVKTFMIVQSVISLFVALTIFYYASTISLLLLKTDSYFLIIQFASAGLFLDSFSRSLQFVIRALQKFNKMAKIDLVTNFISRITSILLFFIIGFKGLFIGFLSGDLISVCMYCIHSKELLFTKSPLYNYKKLIRYSLPYYGSSVMRYFLMNFDRYLIVILLEPHYFATYYIANKFIDYLRLLIDAVMNPILPKMSEFKAESIHRVKNSFKKVSRYISFTFIPLSFGLASLSYPLLYLYGGEKYTNGIWVLSILFISMIVYSLVSLFIMNIYILGKPSDRFKVEIIGGILNTILCLVLIYFFQINGIASAKLITLLVLLVVCSVYLKKFMDFEIDTNALIHSTLLSIVMASIIVGLQLVYYNLAVLILYIMFGVTVFLFLFARTLEQKDWHLIEDFLPKKLYFLINILYFFKTFKIKSNISIGC